MKQTRRQNWLIYFSMISFLFLLFSCPNGVKIPKEEKLTSIKFIQQNISLSLDNRPNFELWDIIVVEPKEARFALDFSSSDSNIVSVRTDGTINAKAVGTCKITAKADKYEATVDVEVIDTPINEVQYKLVLHTEKADSDEFETDESTRTAYVGDVVKIDPSQIWPIDTNYYTFDETASQVAIAEDGSTVINVYLRRKKFTLTLDLGNGKVETYTEKYEAKIPTIPNPTIDGLTFIGWFPELPTRFIKNITCQAKFDNPNATDMDRFKALLPFPVYNSSMGGCEFKLPKNLKIESGSKTATVEWSLTKSFNSTLDSESHFTKLTFIPDIFPEDLTLTATISYNGETATETRSYHIDPVLTYNQYSNRAIFTPDKTYKAGKVRLDVYGFAIIYNYTVDPTTHHLNLSLDRHYIDAYVHSVYSSNLFFQNLNIGWHNKGEFEKLFNDHFGKFIKDVDTYYNESPTKKAFVDVVKSNTAFQMLVGLNSNPSNEEIEKAVDEELDTMSNGINGKPFGELTNDEQNALLKLVKERMTKGILEFFRDLLSIHATTWEEFKPLTNNKNLYEAGILFRDISGFPIMDSQLCSYKINTDNFLNIFTIHEKGKLWQKQVGTFEFYDDTNSINYALENLTYEVNAPTDYQHFYGNWNDAYTECNVRFERDTLSTGKIYIKPSENSEDAILIYGNVIDSEDASKTYMDVNESSPIELKFKSCDIFFQ